MLCEIVIQIVWDLSHNLIITCEVDRRVNLTLILQMKKLKFKVINYDMLSFVLNSNNIV